MAIDELEVHVVGRHLRRRFNMEFVFVVQRDLDDGQRLLQQQGQPHEDDRPDFNDKDTEHVVLKNVDPTNTGDLVQQDRGGPELSPPVAPADQDISLTRTTCRASMCCSTLRQSSTSQKSR